MEVFKKIESVTLTFTAEEAEKKERPHHGRD